MKKTILTLIFICLLLSGCSETGLPADTKTETVSADYGNYELIQKGEDVTIDNLVK